MKDIQKEIAQELNLPDAYWNYKDTPNDSLEQVGNGIADAIGKGIAEALSKGSNDSKKADDKKQVR